MNEIDPIKNWCKTYNITYKEIEDPNDVKYIHKLLIKNQYDLPYNKNPKTWHIRDYYDTMYEKVVETNNMVEGYKTVGCIYEFTQCDKYPARHWYKKMIEAGNLDGYICIGDMYNAGKIVQRHEDKMVDNYKKAAKLGLYDGIYRLCNYYERWEMDYQKAMKWYIEALKLDSVDENEDIIEYLIRKEDLYDYKDRAIEIFTLIIKNTNFSDWIINCNNTDKYVNHESSCFYVEIFFEMNYTEIMMNDLNKLVKILTPDVINALYYWTDAPIGLNLLMVYRNLRDNLEQQCVLKVILSQKSFHRYVAKIDDLMT